MHGSGRSWRRAAWKCNTAHLAVFTMSSFDKVVKNACKPKPNPPKQKACSSSLGARVLLVTVSRAVSGPNCRRNLV